MFLISEAENKGFPCSDLFSNAFNSINADMQHITDKLGEIMNKLDTEVLKLHAERFAAESEEVKEEKTLEELMTDDNQGVTGALKDPDSVQKIDVEDGDDAQSANPFPDAPVESDLTSRSSNCNDLKGNKEELTPSREGINNQSCFSSNSTKEEAEKGKKEKNSKWVTVG